MTMLSIFAGFDRKEQLIEYYRRPVGDRLDKRAYPEGRSSDGWDRKRLPPPLSTSDLARAHSLWKRGKGTDYIADVLKVDEARVFNSLRELREQLRRARRS